MMYVEKKKPNYWYIIEFNEWSRFISSNIVEQEC